MGLDNRVRLGKSTGLVAGAAALGASLGLLRWWRGRSERLSGEKGPSETLQRGEALSHAVVEQSPDVVMILNADSTIWFVSPSVHQVLGYKPEDLVGTDVSRYLRRQEPGHDDHGLPEKFHHPGATQHSIELFEARYADGSNCCLEAVIAELPDDAGAKRAYYLRDVTERKSLEDELVYRAFHDPLTGLANRALFMDRLEHVLSRLARQHQPVAVLFIDIDDFKAINDRVGHTLGDQLLITTGQRVRGCLRPTDTAARFGGDEFTVLLENVEDADSASQVAVRILKSLKSPVVLGSHKTPITASIGVAMSGAEPMLAEDLLRAADGAMYLAKGRKGSSYATHEANVRAEPGTRTDLEMIHAVQ